MAAPYSEDKVIQELEDERDALKIILAAIIGIAVVAMEIIMFVKPYGFVPDPTVAGGVHTIFVAYSYAVGHFLYKKFNGK